MTEEEEGKLFTWLESPNLALAVGRTPKETQPCLLQGYHAPAPGYVHTSRGQTNFTPGGRAAVLQMAFKCQARARVLPRQSTRDEERPNQRAAAKLGLRT